MEAIVLLRLMMTINKEYTNAEPKDSITPSGFISSPLLPCVMITTPPKVAAMASHTGHEGTTPRKTMMMATSTDIGRAM